MQFVESGRYLACELKQTLYILPQPCSGSTIRKISNLLPLLRQWHLYRNQGLPPATMPRQQCTQSSKQIEMRHAWQLGTQSQAEETPCLPAAALPLSCSVSVSCCLPAHRKRWAG